MKKFFNFFWDEFTVKVNDHQVIELGGFLMVLIPFTLLIILLSHFGIIS